MKVMTSKKTIVKGNFTYKLMGSGDVATHVHINNHKTGKSSQMVSVDVVRELLNVSSQ